MRKIEEKLKEKSFLTAPFDEELRREETVVLLSDALEILKDCYTKEEVKKLLKKQKKLCSDAVSNWLESPKASEGTYEETIETAPQPKLKGDE